MRNNVEKLRDIMEAIERIERYAFHNTSQNCSRCSHEVKKSLSTRTHVCPPSLIFRAGILPTP